MPAEVPALRRNGRIPSCEPCRKSKLACGHEKPKCHRCIRAGRRDACTYHPAPMAGMGKRARGSSPDQFQARPKPVPQGPATSNHAQSSTPLHSRDLYPNVPADSPAQYLSPPLSLDGNRRSSNAPKSTYDPVGYLGSTSYIAALAELGTDESDHEGATDAPVAAPFTVDAARLQQGAYVLKALTPFTITDELMSIAQSDVCISGIILAFVNVIWAEVRRNLVEIIGTPNEHQMLLQMSRKLFKNTSKPLSLPGSVALLDYASFMVGENLRWEAVGLLHAALSLRQSSISDLPSLQIKPTRETWKRTIDATNACLNFCDQLETMNDIILWTLQQDLITLTLYHGDSSYVPWKRLGDLSSAFFALGMHQKIMVTREVPRWLAEVRKTTALHIYFIDKNVSLFVGRPPRISWKYCALQNPMTLDIAQLSLPADELEAEVIRLGDDAWKPRRVSHFAMHAGLSKLCSIQRERVLELFLGPEGDKTEALARDLVQCSQKTWHDRPTDLKYDESAFNTLPAIDASILLMMHLDLLYNDFLLQRFMVQKLHHDSTKLLTTSSQLISTALAAIKYRSGTTNILLDIPYTLALYGLGPAGVLSLELIRQARNGTSSTVINRSEVIRDMCTLVSSLDWVVKPGDGNYTLCTQGRRMLQRVLDKILSPSVPQHQVGRTTPKSSAPATAPDTGIQANIDDLFWFGGFDAENGFEAGLEDCNLLNFNSIDPFWPRLP